MKEGHIDLILVTILIVIIIVCEFHFSSVGKKDCFSYAQNKEFHRFDVECGKVKFTMEEWQRIERLSK